MLELLAFLNYYIKFKLVNIFVPFTWFRSLGGSLKNFQMTLKNCDLDLVLCYFIFFIFDLDFDLDLVGYFTGTLSFEWVINVKGGIYNVASILIIVS